MKLKGKIQRILPMQRGTSQKGNEWQKVEFIVEETDTAYPDIICISAMNDHVQELLGFNQGDLVEVDITCRCNEYKGKVYNSISLFSITKAEATQQAPAQPQPQSSQAPAPQQVRNETIFQGGDGLPF